MSMSATDLAVETNPAQAISFVHMRSCIRDLAAAVPSLLLAHVMSIENTLAHRKEKKRLHLSALIL